MGNSASDLRIYSPNIPMLTDYKIINEYGIDVMIGVINNAKSSNKGLNNQYICLIKEGLYSSMILNKTYLDFKCIKNCKIFILEEFTMTKNFNFAKLTYKFSENVILEFTKSDDLILDNIYNKITIIIKDPERQINIEREMSTNERKLFEPTSKKNLKEFDLLYDFVTTDLKGNQI